MHQFESGPVHCVCPILPVITPYPSDLVRVYMYSSSKFTSEVQVDQMITVEDIILNELQYYINIENHMNIIK